MGNARLRVEGDTLVEGDNRAAPSEPQAVAQLLPEVEQVVGQRVVRALLRAEAVPPPAELEATRAQ